MPGAERPARSLGLTRTSRAAALLLGLLAGACAQPFERWLANRTDPLEPGLPVLQAPVLDLHADSLMWGRDLLEDGTGTGHADVPRLARGQVALQVFTVFTVTPPDTAPCLTPAPDGSPRDGCVDGAGPNLTALLQFLILGRPGEALSARATVEGRAQAFTRLVQRSQGGPHELLAIRDVADLRELVRRRRAGEGVIGALLGLEGAHPLDPDRVEAEVEWLHGLGYRMVGLVHRFDNAFAGASEGVQAGPLTAAGERLVAALQARGMVVDVAHLSPAALQRAAALASRPVVYSHGGIAANCRDPHGLSASAGQEECDRDRNLTAPDVRALAENKAIIGIGYWHEAVGTRSVASVISAMERTAAVLRAAGVADPVRHLAIGSDFDGFVTTAVDATGHPIVLAAAERALGAGAARRIGWMNACEALARALGGAGTDVAFCAAMP